MKNLLEFLKSFSWKLLNWIIRPKDILIKIGTLFFVTGFGGLTISSFSFEKKLSNGTTTKIQLTASENPEVINCLLWGIGIIGFLTLCYSIIDFVKQKRKIVVIGIEHIGLKKRIATPLSSFLKNATTIPIDLTVCYENDKVSNTQKALDLTKFGIEDNLKSKVAEMGNKEITLVYGGMPPVALGFLAGYLMPNTYHVEVWDYDRTAKKEKNWYKLAGYRDSNKPQIDLSNYSPDKEICLLMAISHPVTIEQIRGKVSHPSYVKVTMPEVKYDSMSSIEKVTDFENEFGELLKKLAADGVEKIHVFCAAQSSFNFCMGRQITRNHPEIIIYEYDISHPDKYPWGVLLNTKDNISPCIV